MVEQNTETALRIASFASEIPNTNQELLSQNLLTATDYASSKL